MRIGIVPNLDSSSGGAYQYTLTILSTLAQWQDQREDQYIMFVRPEDEKSLLATMNALPWRRTLFQPLYSDQVLGVLRASVSDGLLGRALRKLWRQLTAHGEPDFERIRYRFEFTRLFKRHGVDWVLYTSPNGLSFEAGVPYVMPVHDLQHLLQPEFPEVSASGEWEWREYLFRNATRYATLILADSEVGKEDILDFYGPYGVTADRIRILPFLPATGLSVDVSESARVRLRQTYHLPERYLFYPAWFWPHKNHARIIQALCLLREQEGDEVHAVFCGSYTGEIRERTFEEVMTLAHRLRVAHQVHYLGYVPDEDISGLYAEAVGLIMPTFFGPTNIPILEAWAAGCPVLTSDVRGIREQVGDAGLLVDPRSVQSIAAGIQRVWEDESLRQELTTRGRRRLADYMPEDFSRRLADIIEEANERVQRRAMSH